MTDLVRGDGPYNGAWSQAACDRYQMERQQPFFDLVSLLRPVVAGTAVDLGCGSGELTRHLHEHAGLRRTVGIDASPAMLARAAANAGPGLSFAPGRIEEWQDQNGVDLIVSNSSLQWCKDHGALLARFKGSLRAGGQLAIQVPALNDHPLRKLALALAAESPYAESLGADRRERTVLPVEDYAALVFRLGYRRYTAQVRAYGYPLSSLDATVEWAKNMFIADYQARLGSELFGAFVAAFRARLADAYDQSEPYFCVCKRILLWAQV